jgi:hypothetical protein
VNGRRFAGSWLIGIGLGSIVLAMARGDFVDLAFPCLLTVAGILFLKHSARTAPRFPNTDLERGLDRFFALLLPARSASSGARVVVGRQVRLAGLRRGARRWSTELQLITTDGYETVSRISALKLQSGARDERSLVDEAVRVLRAERSSAGAELTAGDTLSILAYGLGAQPNGADLASLEALLEDLGLPGDGDELRTHFDEILAAKRNSAALHLRNNTERSMFCDLAGASFVLGASARILELVSLSPRVAAT